MATTTADNLLQEAGPIGDSEYSKDLIQKHETHLD